MNWDRNSATADDQEATSTRLVTFNDVTPSDVELSDGTDPVMVASCVISSVGIIANLTVIVVFVNHKHFRQKIPIKFIINQVMLIFNCLLLCPE